MKIKSLLALLQDCDPEGDVSLSLNSAILDGDSMLEGVEYGYANFEVDRLYSSEHGKQPDRVHIRLSDKETEILIEERRNSTSVADPVPKPDDAVAADAPVAVAVAMHGDTYNNLVVVVDSCNRSHEQREGATTHGKLTVSSLLGMLAEDAAMTNTRPGSWEGANMQQVLDSHGYQ